MENNNLAVSGESDIIFDSKAEMNCRLKCCDTVFRYTSV